MRILFFMVALLGFCASIAWSVYIHGMACSFVTNPSSAGCPAYTWPWQLSGEDFIFMGLPQIVFAGLLVCSIIFLKRRP